MENFEITGASEYTDEQAVNGEMQLPPTAAEGEEESMDTLEYDTEGVEAEGEVVAEPVLLDSKNAQLTAASADNETDGSKVINDSVTDEDAADYVEEEHLEESALNENEDAIEQEESAADGDDDQLKPEIEEAEYTEIETLEESVANEAAVASEKNPLQETEVKRKPKGRPRKDKSLPVTPVTPPEEIATSSNANEKEEEIEQNQCRVCTSKDDLIDIFGLHESERICDQITTICSVKIMEKDFLPQLICVTCADKVKIAYDLKNTCEATDAALRKKLKRSKNKIRRPREFILIDCEQFSSGSDDEERNKDDEEFKLSEVSLESEVESDSDASVSLKKKKTPNKRKSRRTSKKQAPTPVSLSKRKAGRQARKAASPSPPPTKRARRDVVYIKEEDLDYDEVESPPKSKRGRKPLARPPPSNASSDESSFKSLSCPFCDKIYTTVAGLREHKKSHAGDKPFECHICKKIFKLKTSLQGHILKHTADDTLKCNKCNRVFGTKLELRRHNQSVHGEVQPMYQCTKCKRTFVSQVRLKRHMESPSCIVPIGQSSVGAVKKKHEDAPVNPGRDLFKCVAPLTTTYWSDSFSE